MNGTDAYGGMNPWTLARSLRSGDCPCPACGGRSSLEASVENDVLDMKVVCPKCGDSAVTAEVRPDGDVHLHLSSGEEYEPSFEVIAARKEEASSEGIANLEARSRLAHALAHSMRESAATAEGISLIKDAKLRASESEEMRDIALRQATATAGIWMDRGDPDAAIDVYDGVSSLAEGCDSASAYALLLNRSFAQYATGEASEPLKTVRSVVADVDRMKSEGRMPEGDPFLRARAYEALGVLLSSKNDRKGFMNAMKKAVEETASVLSANVSDESIRWYTRCAREYAFACAGADMKKRSLEALKNAVKAARNYRKTYPGAFAEALLERAMFISASGSPAPANLRADMDEVIALLSTPDAEGGYDPMLPVAYFYRSTTGPGGEDELDGEDLAKAYSILRDGTISGNVPDSVFSAVSNSYLVYLEGTDKARADVVREELRSMGLFVSMGQSTVKSQ